MGTGIDAQGNKISRHRKFDYEILATHWPLMLAAPLIVRITRIFAGSFSGHPDLSYFFKKIKPNRIKKTRFEIERKSFLLN